MDFKIPKFKTDKELFDFLVENEDDIFYSKKSAIKHADGFCAPMVQLKPFVNKSDESLINKDQLSVVAVINTTNILDSHGDVHIDGLWDKSLSENTRIKHLQEHKMSFESIIADKDDLKAYTKTYNWKDLGYDADGQTQALVFESTVKRDRNGYMFKQYAEGNVDNHSVGMRYVKLFTCINDEDYEKEYDNWQKYSKHVINKAELERTKFFWAVTEAKVIEGSAVPVGSNTVTPTQSVKSVEVVTDNDRKMEAIKSWLSSS